MMGRLTTEVTRLVGEIQTARDEREQATAEMKRAVARMQGGFRTAHVEMARRQRRNLREFMSGLESRVGALRHAFRTDLAGARAAWHRVAPAPTGRDHAKRAAKAAASAAR